MAIGRQNESTYLGIHRHRQKVMEREKIEHLYNEYAVQIQRLSGPAAALVNSKLNQWQRQLEGLF